MRREKVRYPTNFHDPLRGERPDCFADHGSRDTELFTELSLGGQRVPGTSPRDTMVWRIMSTTLSDSRGSRVTGSKASDAVGSLVSLIVLDAI